MPLSTYYHTLKYLKFEQIFFQVYYKIGAKLRHLLGIKEKYSSYKEGHHLSFYSFPDKPISYKGNDVFEFLNLKHKFSGAWDDRALGDLWRYNLNYMDFILQPTMAVADAIGWVDRFIVAASSNKIATDPYPISLRGINWIKFISLHWNELNDAKRRSIDTSLYSQYRILIRRTERHLLANHYLENGFSILFAAVYFQDKIFWNKAKDIVHKQMTEQILSDGAHYELSPMYHCIILERVLDCCNLLSSVDDSLFDGLAELREFLQKKATLMLSWLDAIVVAGNSIPLLNDSAKGVALLPDQLRDYAMRLGLEWSCGVSTVSGYRRVKRTNYEAFLDMAPLGASYNLGHAHADSSTFLLWVCNRELLVDTGISTYNAGERRNYERSTRAHNTVVVDNSNSSKVWGAFRCAQRAQTVIEEDGPTSFALRHNGYAEKGVSCRRRFVCEDDFMEIIDTLERKPSLPVAEAYFHLSPDVQILSVEDNRVVTNRAVFVFKGHESLLLLKEKIACEYNVLQPTQCIRVKFNKELCTKISDFKG